MSLQKNPNKTLCEVLNKGKKKEFIEDLSEKEKEEAKKKSEKKTLHG